MSINMRAFKFVKCGSPFAVLILALTLISNRAFCATPTLPVLSQTDFNNVIRELSANSLFNAVTPPSALGSIFGFELGVTGGLTSTPEINKLVNQQVPNTKADLFPNAALLASVSTPISLTAEALYIPQISAQGVKYDSYGGALKYTPTNDLIPLPLNIALRGFFTKTRIQYDQVISSATGTVTYEGQVTGLQLMVSPKLIPIFEPYAGAGLLAATGKMSITGTSNLFNFTSSQTADSSPTSSDLFIGLDIRLLLIGIGLQYERAFGTDAYTGKVSFKF